MTKNKTNKVKSTTKVKSTQSQERSNAHKQLFWIEAIAEAKKTGQFSKLAKRKAGDWPDCACGAQSKFIEREPDGAPYDELLLDLGGDFVEAVDNDDAKNAERLLNRIEKRAAKLLQDEITESKKYIEKIQKRVAGIEAELRLSP